MNYQILAEIIASYEIENGIKPHHIVCSQKMFGIITHTIMGTRVHYSFRVEDNVVFLLPGEYSWDDVLVAHYIPLR